MDRLPNDLRAAMEGPESMEVFKIESVMKPAHPGEKIRDYPVLKRIDVQPGDRPLVTAWLRDDVLSESGDSAKCFDPHDALRVKKGGDTFIVLVCTSCGGVAIFRNEKRIGSFSTKVGAKSPEGTLRFLR